MLLLCAGAFLLSAADEAPAAGRWEGIVHVPGQDTQLVLDLDRNAGGQWIGSATLPGSGVQGAALTDLKVDGSEFSCAFKDVLGGPKLNGSVGPDGSISGTFALGGNSAGFTLQRTGDAQVEPPLHSTAVRHEFEGDWEGDITVLDHPVHAKLSLTNHENGQATAKLVIKGRQENVVPVERVTQEGNLITLDVPAQHATYDGRMSADGTAIDGVFEQQSVEFPILFHRAAQAKEAKR